MLCWCFGDADESSEKILVSSDSSVSVVSFCVIGSGYAEGGFVYRCRYDAAAFVDGLGNGFDGFLGQPGFGKPGGEGLLRGVDCVLVLSEGVD